MPEGLLRFHGVRGTRLRSKGQHLVYERFLEWKEMGARKTYGYRRCSKAIICL